MALSGDGGRMPSVWSSMPGMCMCIALLSLVMMIIGAASRSSLLPSQDKAPSPLANGPVASDPAPDTPLTTAPGPSSPKPVTKASPQTTQVADNPSHNIQPQPDFRNTCSTDHYDDSDACVQAVVEAIDNARQQENISSISLPTDWFALTPVQQLFVATNLERTARALAPLASLSTTLDQDSASAAHDNQDPTPPQGFAQGSWGGNWAGDVVNPLEDLYFWMYYDGYGPNGNNLDCQHRGDSGCWVHRDNVLLALRCQPCVMGAGYDPTAYRAPPSYEATPSWAELLADTQGNPEADYSWDDVTPYLPGAESGAATSPSTSGSLPTGQHRLVEADGGIFTFDGARSYGNVPVRDLVGTAATLDDAGYWLVASDGGIFAFGDANYFGSVPGTGNQLHDLVAMTATPDGDGYWIAGRRGEVFSFGDARYHGSIPGVGDSVDDIVGMAMTPDGGGYWLVGSDGGIFAFGDAPYLGSVPGVGDRVDNIVSMASTPDGAGYWLVGSDGGVFAFGNAGYFGSVPGVGDRVDNIVSMNKSIDGAGYWLVGSDGGVFAFGDAGYFGSVPALNIKIDDVVGSTSD